MDLGNDNRGGVIVPVLDRLLLYILLAVYYYVCIYVLYVLHACMYVCTYVCMYQDFISTISIIKLNIKIVCTMHILKMYKQEGKKTKSA